MKKILLASTAIVGGALMASSAAMAGNTTSGDNYSVSLGGIHRVEIAQYSHDRSTGNGRGYGIKQPFSEVWVKAKATADNGITYGIDFEVEARGDATEATDEAWAYLTSDQWGRVEMGNQDGAQNRMMIQGHNALVATGGYFGGLGMLQFAGSNFGSANLLRRSDAMSVSLGGGGDATKLIYFTPRFSGFQLGASLTPNMTTVGRASSDNDGSINNMWELGANYVGKFGDVGVTVAATYMGSSDTDGASTGTTANQKENVKVWNVGAKVAVSGFTVAAGYQDNGDTTLTKTLVTAGADMGKTWNVGLGYKTGPWGVSTGYHYGKRDLTLTTEAKIAVSVLGAQYAMAPGWTVMGELGFWDVKDGADAVGATDRDVQVFMLTNQFVF